MTTKSIKPVRLIRDSIISTVPIYKSLLVFFIPGFFIPTFIFSLLKFVIPEILFKIINYLYLFSISPILSGAIFLFSYKKLNKEKITISQALQQAFNKFPALLLLEVMRYFLYLIPPFFPRFYSVFFTVIIDDYSLADSFKRSWQLTKGYGWRIFWITLTILFIPGVLNFFSSLISASIFGVSVWELNRGGLLASDPAFIMNILLTISVYFLIYLPLINIYKLLIFMRLLGLEKRKLDSVTM